MAVAEQANGAGPGGHVFLTGATGFLGSHTAEVLAAAGYRVTCLVRKTSNLRWLNSVDVELVHGDVTDLDPASLEQGGRDVLDALARARFIIHVAGVTKAVDPADYQRINAGGVTKLMDAAVQAGAKPERVVLVSSLAAIGPATKGQYVRDSDPPHPVSIYGQSKRGGENALGPFNNRFATAIVRPPVIYGPRDEAMRPLFKLAKLGVHPLMAGGQQRIGIAHVRDVIGAIETVMTAPGAVGRAFLVTDPQNPSQGDLFKLMGRIFNKRALPVFIPGAALKVAAALAKHLPPSVAFKYVDADRVGDFLAPSWMVDDSPLRALGFRNRVELAAGFAETAEWYTDNGWL
jgi:nucleoside-diphosphate-sugar epimerase